MTTIHFSADSVNRSKQLELHQRTAKMTNEVLDAVRGRIRDLRIVPRNDDLELHGVCSSDSDASEVLESARRVLGAHARIMNKLNVIV